MLPLASRAPSVRLAMAGLRKPRAKHAALGFTAFLLTGLMLWPSTVLAKVSQVFGTYSADKPTAMAAQLRPSLDRIAYHLGQILGEDVEINMNIVRTYDAGAELIVSGTVDFMRHGIHAKDMSNYEYLGRHDKVGRAVGSGQYDAGALEGTTFAKLVAKGVPLRAIATCENSTRPWVARAGMDERIVAALRETLLRLDNDEALLALRFKGSLPGEDAEYEPTREAIRENPRFFEQISRKP